jgi:hypothetical protein
VQALVSEEGLYCMVSVCPSTVHWHLMLQVIFDKQEEFYSKNGCMTVDKNLPPVAGALHWIHKLRLRIMIPTEIVKELELS